MVDDGEVARTNFLKLPGVSREGGEAGTLNLIHRDHAQDFLQRGLAFEDAAEAVLPHRLHPLLDGDVLQRAKEGPSESGVSGPISQT